MSFLINQIKEQKILEMEVNLDEFVKEHNISETAIIQRMDFDKEVFADEKEVREYLKLTYLSYEPKISEFENSYEAVIFSEQQIDEATEIVVELRRGIKAYAYDLKPVENTVEIQFNNKGVKSFVSHFDTIDFNNGLPHIIEIAKVATGYHPRYGQITVTQEHLESFVKNFNSRVTDIDLAVNEDHEKKEAFGWYKDIWLSHDGQTLYGSIQWNTKGVSALSNKDYRYFSPEFHFNYTHELSGIEYGPTLLGGALTNYPFLKMDAIVDMNNKNQLTKEEIVSEKQTIDLNVHTEQVVELNGKISNLQIELNAKVAENKTLAEEVKTLKATIEMNTKKQAHQKLFDEGHINAAQLVALNDGKTMLEVLALNEKRNETPSGGDGNTNETVELNDGDKKIAEQMGLTPEEYKAIEL